MHIRESRRSLGLRFKIALISFFSFLVTTACALLRPTREPSITCYATLPLAPTDTPTPQIVCYVAPPLTETPTPTPSTSPLPTPTPTGTPQGRDQLLERLLAEGRLPEDVAHELKS